jgi:hypothetical protein
MGNHTLQGMRIDASWMGPLDREAWADGLNMAGYLGLRAARVDDSGVMILLVGSARGLVALLEEEIGLDRDMATERVEGVERVVLGAGIGGRRGVAYDGRHRAG